MNTPTMNAAIRNSATVDWASSPCPSIGSPPRTPTDAAAATRAALRAFVPRARAARVTLIIQIDPAAPPVTAGREEIETILDALLANAMAPTGAGGQITVAVQRGRNGGCMITVSDTGAGMNGAEAAAALAGETTPDGGLSRARHIAARHGAPVMLHSTPGIGTVVTMSFPPIA